METNLHQLAQSEILFIYVVHANRDGTQNFYKGNWKPRQGIGRGEWEQSVHRGDLGLRHKEKEKN
jgi:hypothetical protein